MTDTSVKPIITRKILYNPHFWHALADACVPVKSLQSPRCEDYLIAHVGNMARAIAQLPDCHRRHEPRAKRTKRI